MGAWLIKLAFVALGGAAGSVARYLLGGVAQQAALRLWPSGPVLPWGTLAVNLIGSLVIGFLMELSLQRVMAEDVRLLLVVGVLGGFTTFSALSYETGRLVLDGEYAWAVANMSASMVGGLTMMFVGIWAARALLAAVK